MVHANETRDDPADRRANTHYVHFDPATGSTISEVLVRAVADLAGTDPLELDPLYETIDPDTLDEFVGTDELPDVAGTITFTFEGYEVTVHASGLLEITPLE